jgi:hypothetical protein
MRILMYSQMLGLAVALVWAAALTYLGAPSHP